MSDDRYDAILVGTGFASSFFLHAWLARAPVDARVLVLERGRRDAHSWQIENQRNSSSDRDATFVNATPEKPWIFTLGFGGGSNCWWGVTPRMLPNDFRLHTRYGVGRDWPLGYDELEPYYAAAEALMAISGPSDDTPFPRSSPYPQPPHRFTDPERILKQAYPGDFFHQPTARARVATARRPACCATGVCKLCPIDAKFRIGGEMRELYEDARVSLALEATALAVETAAGIASGVRYRAPDGEHHARAELVVLGANAIFNPQLLLRSGIALPATGRRLNEQVAVAATLYLDGVDNFQGSTSVTGHGYMFYDGPHRSERPAALLETWNSPPRVRADRGRWRQRLDVKFILEDLPRDDCRVAPSPADPDRPEVHYPGHSSYAQRGVEAVPGMIEELGRTLPIEDYWVRDPAETEAHIQGTAAMGDDPATSVVDRRLVHHEVRNLLVLGASAFPTCPPANPTLTIAALSLWAAGGLR